MMRKARRASTATVATYRDDPLYPRIERAVAGILAKGKVVAPVDVLIGMGLLAPEKLKDWRRGRVHYLERVINCNLMRLSRILRILRFHAHDLNLVPSFTAYMRWGKGPKQRLAGVIVGQQTRCAAEPVCQLDDIIGFVDVARNRLG